MAYDLKTEKGRVEWAVNTLYQINNDLRKGVETGLDCKPCFALDVYRAKGIIDGLWEEYSKYVED